MKRNRVIGFIILLAGAVLAWSIFATNSSYISVPENTSIQFSKNHHNYRTLKLNSNGETEFSFTNTGKSPLLIFNVTTSCGCAVPEWPEKPVRPGNEGSIIINYDTSKPGRFRKSIKVFTNVESSPIKLTIDGEVIN